MKRKEFLDLLENHLKARHIADIEGILEEYAAHFDHKQADGFSEEEIAARLGSPEPLASQFDLAAEPPVGGKALLRVGFAFSGLVFSLLLVVLFAWVAVLGAFSFVCAVAGILLAVGGNIAGLLPHMPWVPSLLFSLALLGVAVLAGLGTLYCFRYIVWMARSYVFWQNRALQRGGATILLPPTLRKRSPRGERRLRLVAFAALALAGIGIVLGCLVAAFWAGAVEFWHVWGWFAP